MTFIPKDVLEQKGGRKLKQNQLIQVHLENGNKNGAKIQAGTSIDVMSKVFSGNFNAYIYIPMLVKIYNYQTMQYH